MKIEEYIRKNRSLMDADQPDEDLIWMGIMQSLEKKAKQKRILYWRNALLAAAMVVLVFTAGLYVTRKSENHPVIASLDHEPAQQNDESVHHTENQTQQIQITQDTEQFANSVITTNRETAIRQEITQMIVDEPTNDEKLMTIENLSDNEYIAQVEVYEEKVDEPENQPDIQLLRDTVIPLLDISLVENKADDDETDAKKIDKWLLAAAFGTVAAGGSNDANYKYDDASYSLRKSAIVGESDQSTISYMSKTDFTNLQHRPPFSFGIKACKNFGQYIGVESGLVYTYLASRFEWSGYHTNQNLHYIGIPANFVLYMGRSKSNWRFYLSGGGMVEKGLRNTSRQVRQMGSETRITTIKTPIEGLQWSLNGAMGVNYRLEKGWGIYFEPHIGYSFDCKQPVNIRTEYPIYVGINFGLHYGF